jgi:hypothetical protein
MNYILDNSGQPVAESDINQVVSMVVEFRNAIAK